ncbi:laccase [Meredithblackwellia eburnea MCA 4105]
MFSKAFCTLALAAAAQAAIVDVYYNITYATANPDGMFERKVVGVNGTWPPPPLIVNVNDTVRVTAHNGLGDQNIGLHHHGMFFNTTSHYDGAPAITQCGTPPGATITYEIPVDTQWGTYWWHSHVGRQYVDGLRAPFLIHNTNETHKYDDEYTVILGDWYHEQQEVLIKQFLSVYNPTGAEPVPNSALVYWMHNGTYLDGFSNVTVPFEAGKTYRIRVINTSAFAMFWTWIDGHQMRIIEADGTDTEEYETDIIGLGVAQRYSFLVTAKNDTSSNFAFHANFDSVMFDTVPDDLVINYTSTIQYAANAPLAPEETREYNRVPDELLVPSIVEIQQGPATKSIELGVYFDTFDNGQNRAAFNNITYVPPTTPSLYSALSMGTDANDVAIYGQQTHAYVLEKGDIVDLQVINWDANTHPFHLHGHKVQLVRVAMDVASNDTSLNPPHTEGAANPMRRDTVVVPAGGAYNLRFVADNPGAWVFHCHIEWHFEAGLAVVFIEAPTVAQETTKVPQYMLDQCTAQGISPTGNAVGKNSTTNLSGEATGPKPQVNGWRPRAIGALAGTILAALFGMGAVVWYAFGGQLDHEDLEDEVRRELEAKKDGGLIKRNVKKAFNSSKST